MKLNIRGIHYIGKAATAGITDNAPVFNFICKPGKNTKSNPAITNATNSVSIGNQPIAAADTVDISDNDPEYKAYNIDDNFIVRPGYRAGTAKPAAIANAFLTVKKGGYLRMAEYSLSAEEESMLVIICTTTLPDRTIRKVSVAMRLVIEDEVHLLQFRRADEFFALKEILLQVPIYTGRANPDIDLLLTISDNEGFCFRAVNMGSSNTNFHAEMKALAKPLLAFLQSKEQVLTQPSYAPLCLPIGNEITLEMGYAKKTTPAVLSFTNDTLRKACEEAGSYLGANYFRTPYNIPIVNNRATGVIELVLQSDPLYALPQPQAGNYTLNVNTKPVSNYDIQLNGKKEKAMTWSLVKLKGKPAHTIHPVTGSFQPGTMTEGDCWQINVRLLIEIEVEWPSSWPMIFGDTEMENPQALQNAVALCYAILKQLPERQVGNLKTVTIRPGNTLEVPAYNPVTDEILISKLMLVDPGQFEKMAYHICLAFADAMIVKSTPAIQGQINIFRSILTPLLMARQNYGLVSGIQTVIFYAGVLLVWVPVAGGAILAADFAFIITYAWALGYINTIYGAMLYSDDPVKKLAKKTGWTMNNYNLEVVPIIGWLLEAIFKTEPGYIFSYMASLSPSLKKEFDLKNSDAEKKGWEKAGMCSAAALQNPHTDLSTSIASLLLAQELFSATGYAIVKPNNDRKKIVEDEFGLKDIKPLNARDLTKYMDIRFRLYERRKAYIQEEGNMLLYQYRQQSASNMQQAVKSHTDMISQNTVIASTKQVFSVLSTPLPPNPTQFDIIKAMEIHGNGLSRLQPETKTKKGDVITDSALLPYIICEVNEEGKPAVVSCMPHESMVSDTGSNYRKGLYIWTSAPAKRTWNSSQLNTAIVNPQEALIKLIQCWGCTHSPEKERDLTTVPGFFCECLELLGITDKTYATDFADMSYTDVLNYMHTHGEGLRLYDPLQHTLKVGDMVVPIHENTVGVVTRINDQGQPVDVIYGGDCDNGVAGEASGAVKMHHNIITTTIKYFWKADKAPRKW